MSLLESTFLLSCVVKVKGQKVGYEIKKSCRESLKMRNMTKGQRGYETTILISSEINAQRKSAKKKKKKRAECSGKSYPTNIKILDPFLIY